MRMTRKRVAQRLPFFIALKDPGGQGKNQRLLVNEIPKHLSKEARGYWDRLYRAVDSVYEIGPGDILALASLGDAYAEYWEARQYLAEHGNTYDTDEGPEVRQEHGVMTNAWWRAFEGMNHFGMNPMARAGIPEEDDDDYYDDY